jgi:large subunit ribosomal protein L24e
MVERRVCSFCGKEIEPGTGRMYVKKDGSVLFFCGSKCYKNMMELKRVPRRVSWTVEYQNEKKIRSGSKKEPEKEEKKKPVKKKAVNSVKEGENSEKTEKKKKRE